MGIPLGSGPLGSGPTGPGSGFSVMPSLARNNKISRKLSLWEAAVVGAMVPTISYLLVTTLVLLC